MILNNKYIGRFTGSTGVVLLILSAVFQPALVSAAQLRLNAEQWEVARHGERLIRLPVLKQLIKEWSSKKNHKIELQYPGGEEGELWVRELMDWLISLGIPSKYLVAVPGSGAEDIIRFKIIRVGD